MAAERTAAMVVLAVHVVGDGAAERHELCTGNNRRKEPERRGMRNDVAKQHAGLGLDDAGPGVEAQDAVLRSHVDDGAGGVLAGIAIRAAIAVGK